MAHGRGVQVLLDSTSQNWVILGVVTDILNNNHHVRIEACLQDGQPMLSLVSAGQPNYGYRTPSSGRPILSTPSLIQSSSTAQTPVVMMPTTIMGRNVAVATRGNRQEKVVKSGETQGCKPPAD